MNILKPLGYTPEHTSAIDAMDKNFTGSQFDYAAASTKDMVDRASNPLTAVASAVGNVVARPVYDFVDAAQKYSDKGYQGEFSFSPQGAIDFGKNMLSLGGEFLGQKPHIMMSGALKGGIQSLGTQLGESIYNKFNPEKTSIDPTGKNLFTEYYEDNPYAGIEGQTAFLDPVSLFTLGSKILGPAYAYKTGGINELMKHKLRKNLTAKGWKKTKEILKAKAAADAAAGAAAAGQRREGRGGTHMSRSRDQGGLGISQSQAQSISDANRAAGMSGWGLAHGGRASYFDGGLLSLWLK